MTRTERDPYQRLTLLIGLAAALVWTSTGLRVIVTDNEPSVRALFACAAWVLAGFALGSVTWLLAAPRRAKRPADAVMFAGMRAPNALLGIMLVGLAAGVILDPSPSAWGWAGLVAGSLLGGASLGIAFMAFAQPDDRSAASGQPTGASQSGGWARPHLPPPRSQRVDYTLKRNDQAGFRRSLVIADRCRKTRSDLRKRIRGTVGRRRRSSVSAGLPADCLRTAAGSEPLRIWSNAIATASPQSASALAAPLPWRNREPLPGTQHLLARCS